MKGSALLSDHSAMRLGVNYKKKVVGNTNTWKLNKAFLNNQQVTEEIKGESKISRNKWQWKHNSKPMGCSKSSSKREVYSNTIPPQETRKISNRQSNFTSKATGKRRGSVLQNRTKVASCWATRGHSGGGCQKVQLPVPPIHLWGVAPESLSGIRGSQVSQCPERKWGLFFPPSALI